ncbi:MAG: 30S ribosomal protein S6 [Melioribacteraceae bacterium]|nr:30S ribosomal protein S6 [Melioribacteraceae bacterium]
MTTNQYESVVIVNATLDDEQIDAILTKVEDTIKVNGGEIANVDKWGRKRLAYPIQKSKSGYYVVYRFSAPTDLIKKLERMYRLDENIIRYLTIVLDKKALEYYAGVVAAEIEEATVEAAKIEADKIEAAKIEEVKEETGEEVKETKE